MTNTPELATVEYGGVKIFAPASVVAKAVLATMLGEEKRPAALVLLPRIGERWPGQGGNYAGTCRGRDDRGDYHLIYAEADSGELTFAEGIKAGESYEADGHKDFTMPDKEEGPILFGNVGHHFKKAYYWTRTQYAPYGGYAYVQIFDSGYQYGNRKSDKCHVRLVRRVFIRDL